MDKKDIQNLTNQYKQASAEKEEFLRNKHVPEDALNKAKGATDAESIEGESVSPTAGEGIG